MKIHIGIIGLGYWGPNYIRNFIRCEKTNLIWGCDLSSDVLQTISQKYPSLKLTNNYLDILNDPSIDCVAIATPPETHYALAKAVLKSKKHVIIAKPLTTNSAKAKELLRLAKKNNLLLFGDLTFLYSETIQFIQNSLTKGHLGEPLYYDSVRSNLGLIQKEVNVIWDLAPHDFSILDYCFQLKPKRVFATASKHHGNSKTEEMAHITVTYENNFVAHIHVSWLSPVKLRTILIGGTKKMIFFDDIHPDEKIKIYDKGIDIPPSEITPFKPAYRSGTIVIPKIGNEEALYLEIKDIVKQLTSRKINYENAERNIRVVKLLEACDASLLADKPIDITV